MKVDGNTFYLSKYPKKVSIVDVRKWINTKDDNSKKELIQLLNHRFSQRYLIPLNDITIGLKSGFLIIAISCLMIEALESFFQGLPNTCRKSKEIFKNYFSREARLFPGLAEVSAEFYINIRCAILHQAETDGGWRISRSNKDILWNPESKIVNANRFLNAVSKSLSNYLTHLKEDDWDSEIWMNTTKKFGYICTNCEKGIYK